MAHDKVEYGAGHLRAVATDLDKKQPGFLNNTLRRPGACFGIITGKGSVKTGELCFLIHITHFSTKLPVLN